MKKGLRHTILIVYITIARNKDDLMKKGLRLNTYVPFKCRWETKMTLWKRDCDRKAASIRAIFIETKMTLWKRDCDLVWIIIWRIFIRNKDDLMKKGLRQDVSTSFDSFFETKMTLWKRDCDCCNCIPVCVSERNKDDLMKKGLRPPSAWSLSPSAEKQRWPYEKGIATSINFNLLNKC